jgi:hypothetical protein
LSSQISKRHDRDFIFRRLRRRRRPANAIAVANATDFIRRFFFAPAIANAIANAHATAIEEHQ